ncbi:MAG: endonuclease NucS [Acidobacteria bacterium]|nr:endonuclease NucS [Acidobacteriota bacterium]
MEGLESFLSVSLDHDQVMLLWRILEKVDAKSFQGKYQWDNDYRKRTYWQNEKSFDTDTLILLKSTPWLLDDQNKPRKPGELFAPTPENRRLLGSSVPYLHPSIDLADKPENAKSRTLASTLGLHLRADTASVLNYIRSLSGTDIDLKVVRALYRFLDDNHARPVEDFARGSLLLTLTPLHRWWKSHEVFWQDESVVFGEERGYLEHHYPESLKLFFLGVGVAANAQPLDYLKAIQTLSSRQEVTPDIYVRTRNLYRRLWNAIQEDKKLRDNDEQKLIGSADWDEVRTSESWLGRRGEQYNFCRLEQLVWNDHSYIANLFAESLPFWDLEDLREFRDYLKVQPCSQASVSFHPHGAREQSITWSEKVREQLHWLRAFLNSARWKEQHVNASIEELNGLQVWLVEQATISYTLKGVSVRDPEPCLTYFDDDGVLWITSEAAEEEYPDQIGDALQSYFRVSELREFVKDLLTRRLEDVLRIWQKRGLEVLQPSLDLEQADSDPANADRESEGVQTTDGASEQNMEDYVDSSSPGIHTNTGSVSPTASTSLNRSTDSSRPASSGWQVNWGGSGGESESHRTLKERVATSPNLISAGLKLVSTEYEFPSLDRVDILLVTEQGRPVPVEIKTYIVPGDYKGVWQAVKYKHLAATLHRLRCEDVRSILVAYEIPDDVKAKCVEMGIEMVIIPPMTK